MDCWNGGVPGCSVVEEGGPEVYGGEFGWDYDGAVSGEGREEGG